MWCLPREHVAGARYVAAVTGMVMDTAKGRGVVQPAGDSEGDTGNGWSYQVDFLEEAGVRIWKGWGPGEADGREWAEGGRQGCQWDQGHTCGGPLCGEDGEGAPWSPWG